MTIHTAADGEAVPPGRKNISEFLHLIDRQRIERFIRDQRRRIRRIEDPDEYALGYAHALKDLERLIGRSG